MDNLNKIVSNGKRFIAYELIKRLGLQGLFKILLQLKEGLTERDVQKDKNTKDLRCFFDAKPIYNRGFLLQKIIYIHLNWVW